MVMPPFDNSAGSLLDGIGKNKGVGISRIRLIPPIFELLPFIPVGEVKLIKTMLESLNLSAQSWIVSRVTGNSGR